MGPLSALMFRRRPHERAGFALYTGAVAAARRPAFFGPALGVPDTLDGRFDLIGLMVALLIRRLRTDPDPRGAALAQAVFDAMFSDMDVTLREMGVGDLSVGKRVKRMWEAFHGRARAYEAALDADDRAGLEAALRRNVWRAGEDDGAPVPAPDGAVRRLAAYAFEAADALARQGLQPLLRGEVALPEPAWAGEAAMSPAGHAV